MIYINRYKCCNALLCFVCFFFNTFFVLKAETVSYLNILFTKVPGAGTDRSDIYYQYQLLTFSREAQWVPLSNHATVTIFPEMEPKISRMQDCLLHCAKGAGIFLRYDTNRTEPVYQFKSTGLLNNYRFTLKLEEIQR